MNESHGMSSRLDKGQIAQLWEIFMTFDKNHDGRLTQLELGSLLRSLGLKPSQYQIEALIQKADTNNNRLSNSWKLPLFAPEGISASLSHTTITRLPHNTTHRGIRWLSNYIQCLHKHMEKFKFMFFKRPISIGIDKPVKFLKLTSKCCRVVNLNSAAGRRMPLKLQLCKSTATTTPVRLSQETPSH